MLAMVWHLEQGSAYYVACEYFLAAACDGEAHIFRYLVSCN